MFAFCKWGRKCVTACYICYPYWIRWKQNWALWSKRDLLCHPNITNDVIIYKSSLYATSWTFWKIDLLWHYIRYITKSTPYKIKILNVVVYFYSFPAYHLKICLHWVFSTFNYISNKANLKLLSFVVCLQHFVKRINPQLQPYHLNVSFLPYRWIKAVIILSYHRECLSFLYTLLKYYNTNIWEIDTTPTRNNIFI